MGHKHKEIESAADSVLAEAKAAKKLKKKEKKKEKAISVEEIPKERKQKRTKTDSQQSDVQAAAEPSGKKRKEKIVKKAKPADADADDESSAAKRFVLFVGNLSYNTSLKQLTEFFEGAAPVAAVRLLTHQDTGKPKGCAFVEFDTAAAVQKALKLHHFSLDGRKINVELTAGGGGKGAERSRKILAKNLELTKQRREAFANMMTEVREVQAKQEYDEQGRPLPKKKAKYELKRKERPTDKTQYGDATQIPRSKHSFARAQKWKERKEEVERAGEAQ